MTQKDKELLLRDLSVRLPYGIKGLHRGEKREILAMDSFGSYQVNEYDAWFDLNSVIFKPYLFPFSSITKEQKREYNTLRDFVYSHHYEYEDIVEDMGLYDNWRSIDYLNTHHFDYRGLIEKGLAIDATGLNIY